MYFYVKTRKRIQEATESANDPKEDQKRKFLNSLISDAKYIRQYVKNKSIKLMPMQKLKTEIARILVTNVILEVRKLFRMQERLF